MMDGVSLTASSLKWGNRAVLGFLAVSLSMVLYVAYDAPRALPILAAAAVAVPAALLVFRNHQVNLFLVIGAFVLIADYEPGIQVQEVLYGLYFVAFLSTWFIRVVVIERRKIIRTGADRALVLFLIWVAASASWSLLFGSTPGDIAGEATVLMMLALYFPVKDACVRDERTYALLLTAGAWLAVFTVARNLITYRAALNDADFLWEIATGRVALNEALLMFPALISLVLLVYARLWRARLMLLGMLTLSVGALVATQSRGYWMAFVLGVLVLFALTDGRRKLQLMSLAIGASTGFFLIALIMFPDVLDVLIAGIAGRFLTLGSALTSDLSLINRVYESRAILADVVQNPVIGYGIGARFSFFDLISDTTRNDGYAHNMFVGLLFKFGLVGFGLILYFWIKTVLRAAMLYRREAPVVLRLVGLLAVVCLVAELLVANTSNPFLIADASMVIALLAAAVHGAWDRLGPPHPGPSQHVQPARAPDDA